MTSKLAFDPAWFDPDAVATTTAQFNADLESVMVETPSVMDIGAAQMRALRKDGRGPFSVQVVSKTAEDRKVSVGDRTVGVRIFRPAEALLAAGVYLHIHGGGWCLGGADMQDGELQRLADDLGFVVVSVEYRLAPEHTFPACLDDCVTAAEWVLAHGAQTFETDRFVIGGESAGAHLTALTLLRLRDQRGSTGFLGANLVYGMYDLGLTPSVRNWGEHRLILNTPVIAWLVDQLLPTDQPRQSPSVSPIFADLAELPPALFTVGTLDPLLDDSLLMAARWVAAGIPTELAVFPGGVHGFASFNLRLAQQAYDRQATFFRSMVEIQL